MKIIWIVFKKEVLDTMRDNRTLFTSIILPALLIPLLLVGVGKFQKNILDKENAKKIRIAFWGADKNFKEKVLDPTMLLVLIGDLDSGKKSIQEDRLDVIVECETGYQEKLDQLKSGLITVHFKSTNISVKSRIMERMEWLKNQTLAQRIQKLHMKEEMMVPLIIRPMDIASKKEQIGIIVGGFIPYIFILFSYMGCMYPTIDLITGEKEKKTLETLLTVPASRYHLLLGKVFTISFFGLISAFMSIAGLAFSLTLAIDLPAEILRTTHDIVGFKFILMLFLMLVPLTLFFAGILTCLVIRAKTFKEAQSIVTPLSFVVIIPAMLALMPGMELSWQNSWIPILNVALATKQIIAESIQMGQYLVVVGSLIALALASVFLSYKQFSKEQLIINS